ncbi:hypothetical protein chiPu_0029686, partial [Chiloscyllium punctatum]|nr:hypothetical protein [Chiloscyllium punctatum]
FGFWGIARGWSGQGLQTLRVKSRSLQFPSARLRLHRILNEDWTKASNEGDDTYSTLLVRSNSVPLVQPAPAAGVITALE